MQVFEKWISGTLDDSGSTCADHGECAGHCRSGERPRIGGGGPGGCQRAPGFIPSPSHALGTV